MSKDLKDLIDSIDSANRAHSDLETIIRYLKEEVQRLNFTVNEQKKIIQSQNSKISNIGDTIIPEDVQILKELVVSQREEIVKKEKDIEILTQTLEEITTELENTKKYKEDDEELIYSNKVIVQLTEENELNHMEIEKLKEQIKDLQEIIDANKESNFEEVNQELINTKKQIFQLTEENGLNKVQIETLKVELEESHSTLEEYQEKVNYLQQKLEDTKKSFEDRIITSEASEEFRKLNEKLLSIKEENYELVNIVETNLSIIENLKQENKEIRNNLENLIESEKQKSNDYEVQIAKKNEELESVNKTLRKIENSNKQLSDLIVDLKLQEESMNGKIKSQLTPSIKDETIPIKIRPNLFNRMYNLLDDNNKDVIKSILIENLHEENRELQANAIKILSTIRGPEVFRAFKGLIRETDWIIKLYIIRALKRFSKSEAKELLVELQKDKDVDVREAAKVLLSKIIK